MFFFFNDTATTEIYTLSLHDALPILEAKTARASSSASGAATTSVKIAAIASAVGPSSGRLSATIPPKAETVSQASRSEEHTSELQSRQYLVCRLLLEKKKQNACRLVF